MLVRLSLLVRMLLTLLGAAAMLLGLLPDRATMLPFDVKRQGQDYVIVPVMAGVDLPEGMALGDRVRFEALSRETRMALFGQSGLRLGTPVRIAYVHDGAPVERELQVQLQPPERRGLLAGLTIFWIYGVLLALGLLTLWRGRDLAAYGLSALGLGIVIRNGLQNLQLPLEASFWFGELSRVCIVGIAFPGLFVVAYQMSRDGIGARLRRLSAAGFGLMVAAELVLLTARDIAQVYGGWLPTPWLSMVPTYSTPLFLLWPLALLIFGYRKAGMAEKLRIRWLLWSTGMLAVTVLVAQLLGTDSMAMQLAVSMSQSLAFVGYLYAVLRTRLVDVAFIVDRALAYTATTTLVIGAFALLENWLQQAAVGNNASLLLQGGSTLLLALVLRRVHGAVEHWVDRLFFRRQHHATGVLRQLARDCAHVERREALLDLVVTEVERQLAVPGVAIYARDGEGYRRIAARGRELPARVDADDRAFVALRSDREQAVLAGLDSALGGGIAVALPGPGGLAGALVCEARAVEQFSPDERDVLVVLGRELGSALQALRNRQTERLLADLAQGRLPAQQAIERARQLLPDGST